MNDFWWSLPGPAGFVADAVFRIREGNHIVLAVPRHLPPDIEKAIRHQLGHDWPWFPLPGDLEGLPERYFYECFAPHTPPDIPRTPETLVELRALYDRVFWIRLRSVRETQIWLPFLRRYRAACHSFGQIGPAQLVIVLEGGAACAAPAEEARLVVKTWRNVVSHLESMLHADTCIRPHGFSPLQRQIVASTCASLAMWDPQTTALLADQYQAFQQQPKDFLADIGR